MNGGKAGLRRHRAGGTASMYERLRVRLPPAGAAGHEGERVDRAVRVRTEAGSPACQPPTVLQSSSVVMDCRASLLLLLLLLTGCVAAQAPRVEERPAWGRHFEAAGVAGTFVLYDVAQERYEVYNPARADSGFLPASTFKIPNSLIALETGAVADVDEVIAWDGVERFLPDWNRDHAMRTALPASAVWFYQELARRVGEARMQAYLDTLGYGNATLGGPIDRFWLDGGLRITPREQADFLARLAHGDLPFSRRSLDLVREILIVEATDAYVLRAKSGWAGGETVDPEIGWYVGYVERGGAVYPFALNITIRRDEDVAARLSIARAILAERGLIER